MKNKFSSSVYFEGYLYGFDEKNLTCIDAESGEMQWRKRGFGHGSLFYAEGMLIVLSDEGELALVEVDPERYIERGRGRVFEGRSWTVPTLSSGRLFLRDENEIVALDVAR
jgi:outer membrane protein assembly factor BamB